MYGNNTFPMGVGEAVVLGLLKVSALLEITPSMNSVGKNLYLPNIDYVKFLKDNKLLDNLLFGFEYIIDKYKSSVALVQITDKNDTISVGTGFLISYNDIYYVVTNKHVVEAAKLDFDNDLRRAYNGKLIFGIFQRTVTGTMRGGAKAQFDGDIIMKVEKGDDFKQNYVYHDKNRYQNRDLSELKYNVFKQAITSDLSGDEPSGSLSEIGRHDSTQLTVWDDAIITI